MIRLKQIWNSEKKLSDYIEELKPKKILLPFGHGLGDLVMFINPFIALSEKYPEIEFTLALQKGLGFHEVGKDIIGQNRKVIYSPDLSYKEDTPEYDIIADIDFPMTEGHTEYTKGEGTCKNELGIPPVSGHKKLTCGKNRLIAVQFHITCLPDSCNPDEETAKKIWDDIIDSGFIPIEMHFHHAFDNPANKMFSFVDATVRRCHAKVSSLVGLIENCAGIITVVTGNLHVALSVLPPERIFFLEKDFKLACFTKKAEHVAKADLRNYDNEVKDWLTTL